MLTQSIETGPRPVRAYLALLLACCAASCGDDTDLRLKAIDEVEQACGLTPNILSRGEVNRKFSVPDEASEAEKTSTRNTILVGSAVTSEAVIAQRSCILNFRSRDGYRFIFYGADRLLEENSSGQGDE